MSLPTKDDVQSLQFSLDGSPWCRVTANASIDPNTLEYSLDGSPWWGIGGGGSAPVELLPVFVGNVRATAMYRGNVAITKEMLRRGNVGL